MSTAKGKDRFMVQNKRKQLLHLLKIRARWIKRKLTYCWADKSDKAIIKAVRNFQQFRFSDPENGITLKYNLYTPKDYDANKSYPLVLFIHDAGVVSNDPKVTLIQGLGAVIFAAPSEQAKHECFVLAPQYPTVIVNDHSEAKPHLDVTVNLVKAVAKQFSIDQNRIYTTGQSMGCMTSIEMMVRNPDLFAAALLVAGQWDPARMSVLAKSNLWIVVSEKNLKAFEGMNASMSVLEAAGAKISRATWNGRASAAEFAVFVQNMISKDSNIKYTVFENGSVVPEGLPNNHLNNHIYTWEVAYTIEGLRDWLFTQTKSTT